MEQRGKELSPINQGGGTHTAERKGHREHRTDGELRFKIEEHKELNVVEYIFEKVVVCVGIEPFNHPELRDILFGTYDTMHDKASMDQPKSKIEGLDMHYVSQCVRAVARNCGIHKFYFSSNGEDAPENNKKHREKIRTRLFSRYIHLTSYGDGYILEA